MRASGILLLVVVAIVGGIGLWARSRQGVSRPAVSSTPVEPPVHHVPLLTEAVGYIGAILLIAGAVTAVGQRWDDIATPGRLALLGGAAVLFLGIGLLVRRGADPAFQRLTGVSWAVSVLAAAGTVGVGMDATDASDHTEFIVTSLAATGYAAILWLANRHAIQQAVLFIGVLYSAAAIVVNLVDEPANWMVALPIWAIGVGWAVAGWTRRLTPWFTAVPLGLLVALIAPSAMPHPSGLRYGLGIGTAAGVMAFGVLAKFVPGLAMSSVAMLGYVVGAVTFYFGDTLGVPASLAIAGLAILILATVAMRWHWFSGKREQPPAVTAPTDPAQPTRPGRHVARAPARERQRTDRGRDKPQRARHG